jgi:hypothetical protein
MDENREEIIEKEDPKRFEMMEWQGQPARHYPATGAIMVQDDVGRWIIRGNTGGAPDWDAKTMVAQRELRKQEAIYEGLEKVAFEMDLRSAVDVLATIVAARARNAISDEGRTGNSDAKFVFSLLGNGEGDNEEKPSLRIDMDRDTAKALVERLTDI